MSNGWRASARAARLRRFVLSMADLRAWLDFAKVVNHHNYDHVQPRRKMQLAPGVRISPTASFRNGERISIGPRTRLGDGYALWAGNSLGGIYVGSECSFGPGVFVTASNYELASGKAVMNQKTVEQDVAVGDRSWIGARAIMLPGVSIGSDSVVAAGAVVIRNMPKKLDHCGDPGEGYRPSAMRCPDESCTFQELETPMALRQCARRAVERISGLSIYRRGPRGLNLFTDLASIPAPPLRTVFDVGAHRGESATEFTRVWKGATLYCFEPTGESFEALQARFTASPRVNCYRLALGDREYEGTLFLRSGSVNNSLKKYEGFSKGETLVAEEQVAVQTLDKFCADLNIRHIDFLKVDTEGADMEVLAGAENLLARGAVGVVQVEVGLDPNNTKHVSFESCKSKFEEFGYRLFGIYEQVREFPSHRWHLRRCNAVFISPELSSATAGGAPAH
jgi:FkbM family methyltransferase